MDDLQTIHSRKAELCLRIERQRRALQQLNAELQPVFHAADAARSAASALRRAWPWIGLGVTIASLLRKRRRGEAAPRAPRRSRWLQHGLTAWRTFAWVRRMVMP